MKDNRDQQPSVILTGFADEVSNEKTLIEQFSVFAALGLQYYSIRFVNLGEGVKNVMKLSNQELHRVREIQNDFGLNVSSIGSPIGKIKLRDVEDGTKNAYIPFEKYLSEDVKKVCDLRSGGRGEPYRLQRVDPRRDLPPGKPSGDDARLRRGEPHYAGIHRRRDL